MKKIMLFLVLCSCASATTRAQSKQAKMLMEQIAALQVYIGYAQKGYTVVKKGLNVIGELKKGELDLHTDYFNSLATVSPAIEGYAKVGEILLLQGRILECCNQARVYLQNHQYIRSDELEYLERVFERVLKDCDAMLEQLEAVTTDNQLEMKDSERFERLDRLYEEMTGTYTFCRKFTNEAKTLVISRKREDTDTETARILHGL